MNRPFVVCHMLATVDGKTEGEFFSLPECVSAAAEYGNIRNFYDCQATLYGTATMLEGYSDGLAGNIPKAEKQYPKEDFIAETDVKNYIIAIDTKGTLAYSSPYCERRGRPKAHIIEVLTEAVSADYLAYLQNAGISYIFAGKERLDCGLLLEKLYEKFGIARLMIAGGGVTNRSFLAKNLIDELSLVIAPVSGGDSDVVSVFERSEFVPKCKSAAFEPISVKQFDNGGVWIRYSVKNN
ncbi:MAG: dihydrofolate reductase family protein [Eubacterium sp.]|nr:dihydrofolate reductase family protein [Eubacterium sp.]